MQPTETRSRMQAETGRCSLCGSEHYIPYHHKNGYEIRSCTTCGMMYIAPMPSDIQLAELYAQRYFCVPPNEISGISYVDYEAEEDILLSNAYMQLTEIEQVATRGNKGKILDVGCAYGFFLQAAAERGWDAYGVELSNHAAARARTKLGQRVTQGDFIGISLPNAPFDVITLWDTIEHLVNPMTALRRAHDLLRPRGILAIGTDDLKGPLAHLMGRHWYALNPPWHTHHFSRTTLRTALEQAGFEVLNIKRCGKLLSLWSVAMRLKVFYPGIVTRGLYNWVKDAPFGHWQVSNWGSWICAYAHKPGTGGSMP